MLDAAFGDRSGTPGHLGPLRASRETGWDKSVKLTCSLAKQKTLPRPDNQTDTGMIAEVESTKTGSSAPSVHTGKAADRIRHAWTLVAPI